MAHPDNEVLDPVVAPVPLGQNGTDAPRDTARDLPPEPPTDSFGPSDFLHLPPASERPDAPDGYETVAEIGIGGMGIVFKAREVATNRFVAIKYLTMQLASNALERFRREATALSRLDHPNVVRVLAVNLTSRNPYFMMEYLSGGSLASLLRAQGPLDPSIAAALLENVARGLAASHAAGIVHRDIKPSNILLDADGTAKLADFGLARTMRPGATITSLRAVVGTVYYMSPEQALGHPDIGPAGDVYSLGATLFEALTGKPPFTGEPGEELLNRIRYDFAPQARTLSPAVPKSLSAIVEKCLRKKPALRYTSAVELADELAVWRAGGPVSAKPASVAARAGREAVKRWRWAAAVGVVLAAVGAGMAVRPKSVEAALTAEEICRNLVAGREVTLVGPTGLPKHAVWHIGGPGFGKDPTGDKACYFETLKAGFLELAPAGLLPAFDYTAEVRHNAAHPGDGSVFSFVGLYAGGNHHTDPETACDVITFTEATYADLKPNVWNPQSGWEYWINFRTSSLVLNGADEYRCSGCPLGHFTLPNPPTKYARGPWRKMTLRVNPDGVELFWGEPSVAQSIGAVEGADLAGRIGHRNVGVKTVGGGTCTVPWRPTGSVGLWASHAAVSVRNATLRPTPSK